MTKQYNLIACIGRFQGPHRPHFEMLERAGKLADRVLIIYGSANAPRSPKNPWTVDERIAMMAPELSRIQEFTECEFILDSNVDTIYDDDGWVSRTQAIVDKHTQPGDRIALIGYKKDVETKRYLEMFPQWELVEFQHVEVLDATQIREMYFNERFNANFLTGVTPASVIGFLQTFRLSDEYQNIMEEKKIIDGVRERAKAYPYPPVAVTCDNVVTQSGHIPLIKRGAHPGKGLWALPGGYFDALKDNEPVDGILRELKEETCTDVPERVLRGSIKEIKTFSAKNRSQLGRSITFAAHIPLSGGEWKLPKVKGADDAEKAKWVPFSEIKREMLFDDHYDIISHFVKLS